MHEDDGELTSAARRFLSDGGRPGYAAPSREFVNHLDLGQLRRAISSEVWHSDAGLEDAAKCVILLLEAEVELTNSAPFAERQFTEDQFRDALGRFRAALVLESLSRSGALGLEGTPPSGSIFDSEYDNVRWCRPSSQETMQPARTRPRAVPNCSEERVILAVLEGGHPHNFLNDVPMIFGDEDCTVENENIYLRAVPDEWARLRRLVHLWFADRRERALRRATHPG